MTLPTTPPPPFHPGPDQPDRRCPDRPHTDYRHPSRQRPTLQLPAHQLPAVPRPDRHGTLAPGGRNPTTPEPRGEVPPGHDDPPEGCSCGRRRRRKGGHRGHRRDRHASRRRRFRQRQRRSWRRGEPRRPRSRQDRLGGGPGDTASTPAPPTGPNPGPKPEDGGFTLVDLLLTLAILAIIALVTVPDLMRTSERMRLRVAGSEASRIFTIARSHAALHSTHVGVKFHPGKGDEPTTWSLHRDGDGDGVRSADIRRGDDPAVPGPGGGVHRPARFGAVRLGFPPGPLPRDPGGRRLTRRHDPIRFNRSDVASFGPLGTATPGSLYLTDGRNLAAVRITNRTGRVRVLIYDAEAEEWR